MSPRIAISTNEKTVRGHTWAAMRIESVDRQRTAVTILDKEMFATSRKYRALILRMARAELANNPTTKGKK